MDVPFHVLMRRFEAADSATRCTGLKSRERRVIGSLRKVHSMGNKGGNSVAINRKMDAGAVRPVTNPNRRVIERSPIQKEIRRGQLIKDKSFIEVSTNIYVERRQPSWEVVKNSDNFACCIVNEFYVSDYELDFISESDIFSLRFVRSGELVIKSGSGMGIVASEQTASLHKMVAGHSYELLIKKDQDLQSVTLHFPVQCFWDEIDLNPLDFSAEALKPASLNDKLNAKFFMSAAMSEIVASMVDCSLTGDLRKKFLSLKSKEILYLFIDKMFSANIGNILEKSLQKHSSKIFLARDLISKKLSCDLSVAEISKSVGLNRTTLQRVFKEIFGISISDYARDIAMSAAREYLGDLNLSVAEVADALGYEHHSNFTAAFKKYYGYSPKDYRAHS